MSKSLTISHETTLYVRDHCLCLHAQRAARYLARHFDAALRPVGLTNGQFSLLMALNRPGPAKMASVAALLGLDRTSLTAALKPLQIRGLIVVRSDPDDRRARPMQLTDAGRDVLARAVPVWSRTHEAVEARLGDGGAGRLRHGLRGLDLPQGAAARQSGPD